MSDERLYYPDGTNELTLEWVVRQLHRISGVLTGEQTLGITPLTSTDSPYTVRDGDKVILADTAGGAITVNLQAGQNERVLYIKNIASSGTNAVTVTPDGSDDIDRTGASWSLTVTQSIQIIYSGSEANWFII